MEAKKKNLEKQVLTICTYLVRTKREPFIKPKLRLHHSKCVLFMDCQ